MSENKYGNSNNGCIVIVHAKRLCELKARECGNKDDITKMFRPLMLSMSICTRRYLVCTAATPVLYHSFRNLACAYVMA